MDNINVVIKGKYKGYKIVFDENNKTIQLKNKDSTIALNRKVKSMCITEDKLGTENIHYFELEGSNEKVYCLIDFDVYLILMILGMNISTKCVLG